MKKKRGRPAGTGKKSGRRGLTLANADASDKGEPLEPGEKKKPKQGRLPEMEDPEIEELEAKAEEYADVRDRRMALTPQEDQLKKDLLALMKKHDKKTYVHDGYDIRIVAEEETVKVRIKKEG